MPSGVATAPFPLRILDTARTWLLRRTSPISRIVIRNRDLRVVITAAAICSLSLCGVTFAVGFSLLLGPIVFGMPHLFAEARYLFFQRGCRQSALLCGVLALQILSVVTSHGIQTLGVACFVAILSTCDREKAHVWWMLLFAALVQLVCLTAPAKSRFVLLHAHNCVPILVWLFWRRRSTATSIAVPMIFGVAATLILAGGLDGFPLHTPLRDEVFSLSKIADAVGGGAPGAWRRRWLFFFGFSQAVHYSIWLRLIPEEARARETPRSFAASWAACTVDFGRPTAVFMVVATLGVPMLALAFGAVRVRSLYVTLSEFHATLEAVLISVLWTRRAWWSKQSASTASPEQTARLKPGR
jgi:hypothetical protein